ncbi:hypothetical protein Tco_1486134, partial [Tanacetum coccineum]
LDDDLEEMYSFKFLESFREERSTIEEVDEIQVPSPKKKLNRRRQPVSTKKPLERKSEDQRCIPWTPKEEIVLCKSWVRISEDSALGNASNEKGEEKKSKRYKLSGESSFNTRESGDHIFNLNSTARDGVHEGRPSSPIGRDQAKRKTKAGTSSASLATVFDVESLAKLMANDYAMANDPYNAKKG